MALPGPLDAAPGHPIFPTDPEPGQAAELQPAPIPPGQKGHLAELTAGIL